MGPPAGRQSHGTGALLLLRHWMRVSANTGTAVLHPLTWLALIEHPGSLLPNRPWPLQVYVAGDVSCSTPASLIAMRG